MISIRHVESIPDFEERLLPFFDALMELLSISHGELSLVLCNDQEIQKLNAEWREKDKPTDVLSFPMIEESLVPYIEEEKPWPMHWSAEAAGPPVILGDIVISVETCIRQAEEMNHSFDDEAKRLFTHGLLHLCGYDHEESEEEAKLMFAREETCLQKLTEGVVLPLTSM